MGAVSQAPAAAAHGGSAAGGEGGAHARAGTRARGRGGCQHPRARVRQSLRRPQVGRRDAGSPASAPALGHKGRAQPLPVPVRSRHRRRVSLHPRARPRQGIRRQHARATGAAAQPLGRAHDLDGNPGGQGRRALREQDERGVRGRGLRGRADGTQPDRDGALQQPGLLARARLRGAEPSAGRRGHDRDRARGAGWASPRADRGRQRGRARVPPGDAARDRARASRPAPARRARPDQALRQTQASRQPGRQHPAGARGHPHRQARAGRQRGEGPHPAADLVERRDLARVRVCDALALAHARAAARELQQVCVPRAQPVLGAQGSRVLHPGDRAVPGQQARQDLLGSLPARRGSARRPRALGLWPAQHPRAAAAGRPRPRSARPRIARRQRPL
ncbi:hypothetical protein DB30_01754 [Enhygromyxa salina]|uniref:Uncharacterized protein n=1 Tax=Enhygromyxa salina TaxID=215803 RepID=A0A0C2CWM6_9BACT|nr:hypothetical protein DB30_01754 [Enhygromyxa salina]